MVDLQSVLSYLQKPFGMGLWKRKPGMPVEVKPNENRASVYDIHNI
jgi:hypothetical protein